MWCQRKGRQCALAECVTLRTCYQEQLDAELKQEQDMAAKIGRMCPSMGIYCYKAECCGKDVCTLVEGSLGPVGADKGDASNQPAKKEGAVVNVGKPSWTCPTDKEPCDMFSCNGGQSCFAAKTAASNSNTAAFKPKYVAPPCHTGMNSIGFIGKAEILLGKESAAKLWDEEEHGQLALVLGLLGDPFERGNLIDMNDAVKDSGGAQLKVTTRPIPNIWIRWPDFGIVPFKKDWWENLVRYISTLEGAVLIYCVGGHGRTGTAASIIATLGGLVPEDADPVEWLRKAYCSHVVESDQQLDYIEAMTGRKVLATGSKVYSYSGWTGHSAGAATITHGVGPPAQKKSHGGSGGKRNKGDPTKLSKRKWRAWWRKKDRSGLYKHIANIERPAHLPDGQVFVIGSQHFKWVAASGEFENVTPKV